MEQGKHFPMLSPQPLLAELEGRYLELPGALFPAQGGHPGQPGRDGTQTWAELRIGRFSHRSERGRITPGAVPPGEQLEDGPCLRTGQVIGLQGPGRWSDDEVQREGIRFGKVGLLSLRLRRPRTWRPLSQLTQHLAQT